MALVSPSMSPPLHGLRSAPAQPPPSSSSSSSQHPSINAGTSNGAAHRPPSFHRSASDGTQSGSNSPRKHASRSPAQSAARSSFVELAQSRSLSPLPPPITTVLSQSGTTQAPPSRHATASPPQRTAADLPSSAGSRTTTGSSSASRNTANHHQQYHQQQQHYSHAPKSAPPSHNTLPFSQSMPFPSSSVAQHQPPSTAVGGQFGMGAFTNPAFPFIPSPHPQQGNAGMLGFQHAPYAAPYATGTGEHQHQMRMLQQAQLQQQHHWHMEMMRTQAMNGVNAYDWQKQQLQQQQQQQQQQAQPRRRATSGPAPSTPSPQFHTTPLPYPPSPSPTLQYKQPATAVPPLPSLPSGALYAHFGHGYPTPPGSVERGETNSATTTAKDGYHPYRRGGKPNGDSDHARSSSQPRNNATGTTSHTMTHNPSGSSGSNDSASSRHHRNDSALSALAHSNKPSPTGSSASSSVYASSAFTRNVNSSSTSISSVPGARSARSTPPPQPAPPLPSASTAHTRTDSAPVVTAAPLRDEQHKRQHSVGALPRASSFESARSPTTMGASSAANKKPSPLGRSYHSSTTSGDASRVSSELERPGTPGTLRGNGCAADDDEDSDDTAGATIGPNSARAAQMMQQGLAQGKEKKGMKSRFKKAFGMSSSASTSTLTQADVDGRGAKTYPASALRRQDSMDSIDSATTRQSGHMASGSTSTNGASRPPTTTSTRRFGLLNSKLNSSTDNLSISSTVSSASMLIRKLGNVGKVARRNSLMGLTKAFKSKDKESAAAVDDSVVGVSLPSSSGGLGGPKDKSKGSAATADISHVNAEVDRESTAGMSPAAALAKRQQQMYAEQEAAEALARAERQRNGAQQTKPFAAAAAANASRHGRQDSSDAASIKSSRSFGNWGRNKDDAATATKMLQKEKDKLRKSKGRRWGFGSSSVGSAVDSGPAAADDVSAGNVEVLKPPAYATYGSGGLHDEPGHDTGDEYEPSIFQQEARRAARPSKGILKGAGSYHQDDYALPKPAFPRVRASSFDAPQQRDAPGPAGSVALVGTIPSEAQVDGVVPASTAPRSDAVPPGDKTTPMDRPKLPHGISAPTAIPLSSGAPPSSSSPYTHPSLNASAPVLAHMAKLQPVRSASAPRGTGRRITFATNLSVHTTWPATVYDRRAEPATCNRLTPLLAQQIKEELNSYKMEEMDVHPSSRQLTHFFV